MSRTTVKSLVDEAMGAKNRDKIYFTAYFPDLIDIVNDDNETKFLFTDGNLLTEYEFNGLNYAPPPEDRLGFSLPNYEKILKSRHEHTDVSGVSDVSEGVCDKDTQLFKKLLEYHKDSAELPDERLYLILTAWDFHTHLLEKFEYSPIIFFAGLPEKGKSRIAKSMIAVSRRGIIKASVTDAQLIREASDHMATLFFDTTDFAKSMDRSGSMDVILSRYERGLKVGRVKDHQKGPFQDMVYYDVFGATIISSNQTIDNILGSRTITIVMRQATKKVRKHVDLDYGAELRNELIAWRLAHFSDKFSEPERIINGRFGDIIEPLHQIIIKVYPEGEKEFIDIVKELEKKRYLAKSDSLEGDVMQSIISLEGEVVAGILPVKMITEKINENKSEREKLTYQKIGRKLDIMGFTKARTASGASAIEWNNKLNTTLCTEHNIFLDDIYIERKKEEKTEINGQIPSETSKKAETSVSLQNKLDQSTSKLEKDINEIFG